MERNRRCARYLWWVALPVGGLLLLTALVNLLVDPYGLYGLVEREGFNAAKPTVMQSLRLHKARQVERIRPRAIVLGTSRAERGLDPRHPGFTAQPAYNLAFAGASIYEMLRYYQHARAQQVPEQVVLALDLVAFNVHAQKKADFAEERLAVDPDGDVRRGAWLHDLAPTMLTRTALSASLRTLAAQSEAARIPVFDAGGQLQPRDYRATIWGGRGHAAAFRASERHFIAEAWFPAPRYAFAFGDGGESTFEHYRRLLRLAYADGADLRVLISPGHARQWELLEVVGLWPAWEHWKRELVRLNEAEAARAGVQPFPIWDFSGYNSITTEPVPRMRDVRMRWHWESSHYQSETGDLILHRVFGTPASVPADFGTRLSGATVEAVLASLRRAKTAYRQREPEHFVEISNFLEPPLGQRIALPRTLEAIDLTDDRPERM